MKSIIQSEDFPVCKVCHTTQNLHRHHIFFGTANRSLSEADGLTCYLCYKHHNGSEYGVHFDKMLDLVLKQEAEEKWLEYYGKSKQDFIDRYGKNYI